VLTEATLGIMRQRNVSETGMGTTPRRSAKVGALLHRLANEYPEELRAGQHADVDRIAFHLSIVIRETGTACTVCDLGGGVGLFSVGAAALGMAAVLVDDFGDQLNLDYGEDALTAHRKYGVRVLSTDVLTKDLGLEPSSLDAITSFDSMEHWHHSPKAAFHRMMAALKPGGVFFLGVPNCVNLRKRITVPLGAGKWSAMDEWYEQETFRGHVREPDVGDLRYIARDLGLKDVRIFGRNWLGYASRRDWVRGLTPLADRVLRPFPSLCSDIYLLGRK
jgi:SAM-dependent methyltransferase